MPAKTRVGFGGSSVAYQPFVPRVSVTGPAMVFLGDVVLRGSEVTTPRYERTLKFATDSDLADE